LAEEPEEDHSRVHNSIFAAADSRHPSVSSWWKTVQLYTDQTGANISRGVSLGEEKNDRFYSHQKKLKRLSIQPLNFDQTAYMITSHNFSISMINVIFLFYLFSFLVYFITFCSFRVSQ
jgi:hypothetical protein